MTSEQHSSNLRSWFSLGLAGGVTAALAGLFVLIPPGVPKASAAPTRAEATAGFQTIDKLVLNVTVPAAAQAKAGLLLVQLVGRDNAVLAESEQQVTPGPAPAALRFEFKAPKGPADNFRVRCKLGDKEASVGLDRILLVKAHETALSVGQEFFAGSPASLRCQVQGVKSIAETIPLAGATVEIKLIAADGKAVELYKGAAGGDGVAAARFQIPALPAGTYKMQVATRSALGEEKLEREVKIKTSPRVLLVTDKPLYQPGQVIHLRALALQTFDLKPVAEKEIVFEVEDAKGNKVYKKPLKTSAHGIASADFQLATEVNNGDYRVRALLGEHTAEKTVTVKPYVLPKFKNTVTADKKFYLPKETIALDVQSDYFFGKPVAGGKVKVSASTFDVAFREFFTFESKTDAQGHAKIEIKLPDYFVGQPLAKGDAIVKVEVKLTDTADHTETITKTYPVSDQPVRVSLIPEGGRLVPGIENRIFAAALYPDGSPAQCEVKLYQQDLPGSGKGKKKAAAPQEPGAPIAIAAPVAPGRRRPAGPAIVAAQPWPTGKPLATIKTNEAGLAEFKLTPKNELFRMGEGGQRNVEMLGGQQHQIWEQKNLYDLFAEATDARGATAKTSVALTSEPMGENVLLRLDKAIYKGGDRLGINVHTSAGLPTVYLDIVKSGQTLLTTWLEVKDGKAFHNLDLPEAIFGTLEVHAYQMLGHGEIIRDSRVVYVNPAADLKINVAADKDVYLPGAEGKIRFEVTDSTGKPTAAALGVLIVDEAVYALQEMQPGLEKVYFTLQEELLKPQVQLNYKPGEPIDALIREPVLADARQQAAEILLTAVKPKPPARWEVEPAFARRQQAENQVQQIGAALLHYAANGNDVFKKDATAKKWTLADDALVAALKQVGYQDKQLEQLTTDPIGGKLTMNSLAALEKGFTADRLGAAVTRQRMQNVLWMVMNLANQNRAKWHKNGKWTIPDTIIADALQRQAPQQKQWAKDAWGNPIKLARRAKVVKDHQIGHDLFNTFEMVSAGPNGKFGDSDDVKLGPASQWHLAQWWWLDTAPAHGHLAKFKTDRFARRGGLPMMENRRFAAEPMRERAAFDGAIPQAAAAPGAPVGAALATKVAEDPKGAGGGQGAGSGATAPITRLREYFPETLLWQPALITDEKGHATLPLTFADSITTWRLTASASSAGGLLGGVTAPLRVFQDFFVDLDLPLHLTQNDEVAFPVAVFNYLKTPQTVTLDLQPEPWFELVDGQGLKRSLDLKAGEVTAVKYRIRAKKIGHHPLTVKAAGTKMSDAIKRVIEVVPDGTKVEQAQSDRLAGKVTQTITIPANAIPDASKLFLKVYPGVFSQLVEGTEGILRMPGGCFEQTSSSAYPNILVVDYIKKNRLATPQILQKSEAYLNAGYQRLLTFERPGGGFDWWGSGEPLVWLSAYGLHEFNDMAKVWPIDRGIIDRTQAWLMKQRDKDGTWAKIGATHGESIERMGDPKLLLTSYVTWALLDSGLKAPELKQSIAYIRDNVGKADNAYILALAANALASWDAKDDSTHEALTKVLKKLEEKKQEKPDWKAIAFPAGAQSQSLCYARGDSLTVETTALAVLAMLKSGQFPNQTNQALIYLAKSKDAHGTWGSTQATILALKALIAAAGSTKQKEPAPFTITVNGKPVGKGEVNDANADVMQFFDLSEHLRTGANEVGVEVKGETNLMYQVVGRHFEPHKPAPQTAPVVAINVEYDRTKLTSADLLRAKATLKYNGQQPTFNVIMDLGIPPGFTVDAGDFAELVAAKKVQRFSLTARQIILYLGDVKPGDTVTVEYTLKPKYPIKAKTPTTVAYEYYTPANRGEAKPVELVVEEK